VQVSCTTPLKSELAETVTSALPLDPCDRLSVGVVDDKLKDGATGATVMLIVALDWL
jgi:hypothetical protein